MCAIWEEKKAHQQPSSERGLTASRQEGGSRCHPRAKRLPSGRSPRQGGPPGRPLSTPGPPVEHANVIITSAGAITCVCIFSVQASACMHQSP